jgi:hypothetical protein
MHLVAVLSDGSAEATATKQRHTRAIKQTKGRTMNNTRAVEALLEIMDDTDLTTRRRIEAAEQLLGFEAPEAAAMRAR